MGRINFKHIVIFSTVLISLSLCTVSKEKDRKAEWWGRMVSHSEKVQELVISVKDKEGAKYVIKPLKEQLLIAQKLQKEKDSLNISNEESTLYFKMYEKRLRDMMKRVKRIKENLKNYPEVLELYKKINAAIH